MYVVGEYKTDSVIYDVINIVISKIKDAIEKHEFENPVVRCSSLLYEGLAKRLDLSIQNNVDLHVLLFDKRIRIHEDNTMNDFSFEVTYGLSCPKCKSSHIRDYDIPIGGMRGCCAYKCLTCNTIFFVEGMIK